MDEDKIAQGIENLIKMRRSLQELGEAFIRLDQDVSSRITQLAQAFQLIEERIAKFILNFQSLIETMRDTAIKEDTTSETHQD